MFTYIHIVKFYLFVSLLISSLFSSDLSPPFFISSSIMAERCLCGNWLVAKTAWTELNDGRRFVSCERCRFFRWLDEPLCDRTRSIIPGLLRKINKLEAQQKQVQCKRIGFGLEQIGGHMVCSEAERSGLGERDMEYLKGSKEEKCICNVALTLLIVTWIAIFLYSFCKMQDDVEE